MLNIIKKLKIWQKLVVVVVIMAIPTIATTVLYLSATTNIGSAQAELDGVEYLRPLRAALEHLQQHGGASALVLTGDSAARTQRNSMQALLDSDFNAIDLVEKKYGQAWSTAESYSGLKRSWTELKQKVMGMSPAESALAHTRLTTALVDHMKLVTDASGLILDPDLDTYYLMAVVTDQLPRVLESLNAARTYGINYIAEGGNSGDVGRFAQITNSLNEYNAALRRSFGVVFKATPATESQFNTALITATGSGETYLQYVGQRVLTAKGPSVLARTHYDTTTEALTPYYKLMDESINGLAGGLDVRISRFKRAQYSQFALAGLAFGLVLVLVMWVGRTITGQVQSITGTFANIGMGNFQARAEIITDDELGQVGEHLNAMLDNTLSLIQSREEREQIESSIEKLLSDVSGVAEGDLTRDANVGEDITASIAASFNHMINELRRIISRVQYTTVAVGTSADEVQTTARHLAEGSEEQSSQVMNASKAVDDMAVSIQQVSDNAASAATVAEEAKKAAKSGAESVTQTIEGMNSIRQQVQQTSKRIKRLGERSQEIGEIVQLIVDLANRTSILALNASIQAVAAGEAGKTFGVVAEEVERLAASSIEASKKIGTLVKGIQVDTNEAISAMEETTKEVVGGSNLANQAGKRLSEIESVSTRLAELITMIAMASKQQSRGSEAIARSMGDISTVTQQTASGAKQAVDSIQKLAELADELRVSMANFKLPNEERRQVEV